MSDLALRPNVCILLLNTAGLVFLGERYKEPGIWQFPQGGVEADCSLEANAVRELTEELGVDSAFLKPIRQLKHTHTYEWQKPPSYALKKWRGQSQNFWLVQFTGADSDINLTKHQPQEFGKWRWCELGKVLEVVQAVRVAGYRGAVEEVLYSPIT